MTNTPNLALHTWAPEDPVDVAEVNENFEAIDRNSADMAQSITALAAAIGTGGHTCRIANGVYAGTGEYGAEHPTSLQFDFVPVVVLIRSQNNTEPGTTVLIRNASAASTSFLSSHYIHSVTWSAHGVSWYSTEGAVYQNSQSNMNWCYAAIGYDG